MNLTSTTGYEMREPTGEVDASYYACKKTRHVDVDVVVGCDYCGVAASLFFLCQPKIDRRGDQRTAVRSESASQVVRLLYLHGHISHPQPTTSIRRGDISFALHRILIRHDLLHQ